MNSVAAMSQVSKKRAKATAMVRVSEERISRKGLPHPIRPGLVLRCEVIFPESDAARCVNDKPGFGNVNCPLAPYFREDNSKQVESYRRSRTSFVIRN